MVLIFTVFHYYFFGLFLIRKKRKMDVITSLDESDQEQPTEYKTKFFLFYLSDCLIYSKWCFRFKTSFMRVTVAVIPHSFNNTIDFIWGFRGIFILAGHFFFETWSFPHPDICFVANWFKVSIKKFILPHFLSHRLHDVLSGAAPSKIQLRLARAIVSIASLHFLWRSSFSRVYRTFQNGRLCRFEWKPG